MQTAHKSYYFIVWEFSVKTCVRWWRARTILNLGNCYHFDSKNVLQDEQVHFSLEEGNAKQGAKGLVYLILNDQDWLIGLFRFAQHIEC